MLAMDSSSRAVRPHVPRCDGWNDTSGLFTDGKAYGVRVFGLELIWAGFEVLVASAMML